MKDVINVGCYVRVSTDLQAEKGFSIPEQTERLKKYCDALGWNVYKVYTDGGYSGANIDRPALTELIRDVEHKRINKVVVYKLDRLSRSQKDTLYLIEDVFMKNGCDFISISESFDTASAFGIAMVGILSVFAQLEREAIKSRMKMGKTARAKKGLYNGGHRMPFGYDYKDGHLVVNDFDKTIVKMIFSMYEQGRSPMQIATFLNDNGYSAKYTKWSKNTVHQLLESKVYIGLIKHNDEYYPGEHEAIISKEQFENVQRIKQERSINNEKYQRREGRGTSYLGGLMKCGLCGDNFNKCTRHSRRKDGSKVPYEYYGCQHRQRFSGEGKCTNKIWRMSDLDNLIFDEIRKLRLEPIEVKPSKDIPKLDKQIEKLNGQIEKLLGLYSVGGIPLDNLQGKIKEINDQRDKLEKEQERLNNEHSEKIHKVEMVKMIDGFEEIISSGDIDRVRLMISTLIKKIIVTNDDVEIFWRFE